MLLLLVTWKLKNKSRNPSYKTYLIKEKLKSHILNAEGVKLWQQLGGENTAGKCGNHATVIAPESMDITVDVEIGTKTESCLPTDKDKLVENDLKGSQSGKLEIKIGGEKVCTIKDLGQFKDQIKSPNDIKVLVKAVKPEAPTPFDCPQAFGGAEMAACLAEKDREYVAWEKQVFAQAAASASAAKKHKAIAFEMPATLGFTEGDKDINTMSDAEVEKLTEAIWAASTAGLSSLAATLYKLGGTADKRAFWKQVLFKGKFKITAGKGGSKLIHFYNTARFDAFIKTSGSSASAIKGGINPGTKYKMGKGFGGFKLKSTLPFFKRTKLGYIEKFFSGKTAAGGTIIGILVVGTIETYKWYVDEEAQQIDIFAIWGITGIKAAISTTFVLGATAVAIGLGATSIVVVIGAGVAMAVVVSIGLGFTDSYWGITESAIKHLRTVGESSIRSGVADLSPAGIQP